MSKVTDEHVDVFMAENECCLVEVTRKPDNQGKNVIYVRYTCKCGTTHGKKWKEFMRLPMCRMCALAAMPRVSDDTIRAQVEANGCEFIKTSRIRGGKTRINVTFICVCDIATTRKHKCLQWEVIKKEGLCSDCGNARRGKTNKATHVQRGDEIQAKIKAMTVERYGVENAMQSQEIRDKIIATNISRYGVNYVTQSQEIKDKIIATNISRYGVPCVLQNQEIKDKIKATNVERYGVEYAAANEEVKDKIIATNISRYGVSYGLQNQEIKDKIKATNVERYGVEYSIASKEVKNKIIATNISRYGCSYGLQNQEIKNKIIATNLERYGVEYAGGTKQSCEKAKQTTLDRYGVEYVMQDPKIRERQVKSAFKNKPYVFPNGRTVLIQGYEHFAINRLLLTHDENDILTDNEITYTHEFWYTHDGKLHRYYPDILIISEQKIIEVKSEYTLNINPVILELKMEAVFSAGFEMELWVFNRTGTELTIY